MSQSGRGQIITNTSVLITLLVAFVSAILGWQFSKSPQWFSATLYGGVISAINLWLLLLFTNRLLTDTQGFDYKTLAIVGGKFFILFGGLAAGYFLLKLPVIPLMIGFFSFMGGLIVEVFLWGVSTIIKR